jgi:TolA-binding protein
VLPALLGLAEIEAANAEFEASEAAYGDLIKQLGAGVKHPDISPQAVAASLLDRFNGRFDSGDLEHALRFASLAETVFPAAEVPPDVLVAIARSQRRLALDRLGGVKGESKILDLSRLDPATREQARLELIAAGQYFRRHAERVGVTDNDAYGASLWLAAESFDLAGDPDQAIPLYVDYVKYFPNEPRQPEARFRLAQAYAAKGDYGMAAEYYRGLKEEGHASASKVGPLGDASYVPLAKTLLADGDPSNDSEAEQLLEQVVKGLVGEPTTPQFRDALVELAALRRAKADHTAAVQLLEEAVARFPKDSRIDDLRYDLADSYRQDARAISTSLTEGMPDQRKQALRQARVERLNSASRWFNQVLRSLEAKDTRGVTRLEQMELRNSYFYLGDCAFDLGEYETAIHHYDAARERYPKDPASLVAMIQIVNAYLEMGDAKRAETANNRAKAFYASLPESVWSDPDLPMDKDDWQRWLDAMSRLRPTDRSSAAATEPAQGGGSDH